MQKLWEKVLLNQANQLVFMSNIKQQYTQVLVISRYKTNLLQVSGNTTIVEPYHLVLANILAHQTLVISQSQILPPAN